MNQILLHSGVLFDPLNPEPEKINIDDIAHALVNIPRWTGHTKFFYSVAQHCLRCCEITEQPYKLEVLMHDATEAYLLDMASPIKHRMPEYLKAEKKLHNTIDFVFGLETSFYKEQIKIIDKVVLDEEYYFLMNHGGEIIVSPEMADLYGSEKDKEQIKREFIETFKNLQNERLNKKDS